MRTLRVYLYAGALRMREGHTYIISFLSRNFSGIRYARVNMRVRPIIDWRGTSTAQVAVLQVQHLQAYLQ